MAKTRREFTPEFKREAVALLESSGRPQMQIAAELTTAALMMAEQRQRPAAGLVCHSDRGSQYAAEAYRKQLAGMKAVPSMSRTACCYDDAPMESFFHILKVELVHQRRRATRDEARRDLFAYIEGYYNRQRIHSALGYITPEQAERKAS